MKEKRERKVEVKRKRWRERRERERKEARAASRHRWRRIDGSASSISVADKHVGVRSIAAPESASVGQVGRTKGGRK